MSVPRALQAELGGPAPDALSGLDQGDLGAFAAVLRDAKARQSRELDAAVEQALGVVPRLLRGPIRKALFG